MSEHIDRIFAVLDAIRYVAILSDGSLESSARAGLIGVSASESDKYDK